MCSKAVCYDWECNAYTLRAPQCEGCYVMVGVGVGLVGVGG